MNASNIRKSLGFLLAFALAAFALPSMGASSSQTKHFSVDTVVDGADRTHMTLRLNNDNPSGSNSQIGSFTVNVSSVTGLTISSVTADPASVAAFGGTLSFAGAGSTSFSITGLSPNMGPNSSYSFDIHVTGCGDGNNWGAQTLVYSGTNLSGGIYRDDSVAAGTIEVTNQPCGAADCSNINTVIVTQPGGQIQLVSGTYTQEGDVCAASNYFVTNTINTNDILNFRVLDTQLAFRYSIFDATPAHNPINWSASSSVAWACDPTGGHNECWVPAQPCQLQGNPTLQEKYLPWPYATLVADNGSKITVDTTGFSADNPVPTTLPFRIFIESELLLVTGFIGPTNSTWKVQRCLWGTCKSATTHAAGLNVMSTVLPQLPSILPAGTSKLYVPGTPAQACFVTGTNQLIQSFDLYSRP